MHTRTHSRMHKHACTNPQLRMNTRACTRSQARGSSGLSAAYSQSCRARRCGCMQRHATSAMHSKVRSRRVLPTPRAPRHSEKRGHRVTHSVMHACASACVSHRRLFPVAMSCTVLQHVVRRCNVVHCGQRRRRSRPIAGSSPAGSRRSCGRRRSSTTSTSASLRSRPSASASAPNASSCRSRAPKPKQSHQHSGLQR